MPIDLKKYLPGGDTIKPDDLQGRTVTTTIRKLSERSFEDNDVLYAHIAGRDGERRVKLNGASCDELQAAYGAVVEDWIGRRIALSAAGAGKWRHVAVRPA